MKQNLIQKQIRLQGSKQKNNNTTIIDVSSTEGDIVDFTTKAFFIANQIFENDFLFSKRALATYLYGKPIMLQQKGNQRPPQSLKGYMSLYDDVLIEKLIDLMIDLNILGEKRINLKQRSTKRLFTTKKFQFNTFPKVSIKVNTKRSIQLPFTMKKQKSQNERPKQKQKQKSRLSSFLFTKTSLPVNIQKKQIQLKMKTQRQREQQQQRKRRQQEQIRLKRQQQLKAIEQEKQRQLAIKRKQQQKQQHINKMNNFWLKQKQKIQSFISPSKLRSLNNKSKQQQQRRNNQLNGLQIAGNILHAQMKQLKEQEEQKKNPIKPFISWSFVKNTLGIDSSQSNNQKVEQKSSFQHVMEVKQEKMISQKKIDKSDKKFPSQSAVNKGYLTIKKDKKQQEDLIQRKTPFLGLPISHHKVQQNDQQQHSLSFNNTQSTQDVTMTNYRLQKINKKISKEQIYSIQKDKNKQEEIFAQLQQDSMFSNTYYSTRDKGQQTVTNKKIQKYTQSHKEKKFDENKKVKQYFTFKRRSTFLADQQTLTMARKVNQRCILNDYIEGQGKEQYEDQVQQSFYKRHKRQQLTQDEDQFQHTVTLAIQKKLSQKRKTKEFLQVVFSQNIPNYEVDMFSQTNTIPQPKTKNKKISTSDLFPNKSQFHHQKEFKRDSFVQELINDYYRKK